MITFPSKVEQWRGTVGTALSDLFKNDPSKKSLIDALGSTISDLSDVILAIIQTESSGVSSAIGDSGNSIGLMQLNYGAGTPQGAGFTGTKEDLFNPYLNIYYGSKVFLGHLAKYGNYEEAILAYNAGSVRSGAGGFPINLEYLEKVLSYLSEKKISFSSASWRTWHGVTIAGRRDLPDEGSTIVEFDEDRIKRIPPADPLRIDTDHTGPKDPTISLDVDHTISPGKSDPRRLSVLKRLLLFLARKVFPIS